MHTLKAALLGLGLAVGASQAALAVTVSLDPFGSDVAGAKAAQMSLLTTGTVKAAETFDDFTPVPIGGGAGSISPLPTAVGTFSSLGENDGGKCIGSCDQPSGELLVRNESTYGRFDTTTGEGNWLDSNDTAGMKWEISGLGEFNLLSFLLTDVDDVGPIQFAIKVAGELFTGFDVIGNGKVGLVTILFPEMVTSATVYLKIDDGDGFGIDDVYVAAVPLPAGVLLLLGALGGLGALRRRRMLA